MMHKMKEIQHCLLECVSEEMHSIEEVDTAELGEVIDMIKDLSEAMYYSSVVAAMEEATPEERASHTKIETHQKTV
jgi:hypothetical protein